MKIFSLFSALSFLSLSALAQGPFIESAPPPFLISDAAGGASSSGDSSSPPLEYFSVNTLYLRDKLIVHVGHDLINQNYAVFPSPNLTQVQKLGNDKLRVTIQQYFPDAESRILSEYNIPADKLHYLYITSYEVYDQDGTLLDQIKFPAGVQYRPPQFYHLDISKNVKVLSFVFGFSGRTAWADTGISSDLQGVFRDLRDIGIDQDSAMHLEINASTGVKVYEVLTSSENMKISQILSNFHFIAAWGRLAEKDELINQIVSLKNFQDISIDLSKGVEDLKQYPEIFGNPLDPKWTSVIHEISSQKLTEKDVSSEGSISAKLGLGKFFNFDGGGSKKRDSRFKEMVQFDVKGDIYIPKSINFSLRTNNSLNLINDLVLQVYNHLEEAHFRYGSGISLDESPVTPPLNMKPLTLSPESALGAAVNFQCPQGAALTGFRSTLTPTSHDRKFQNQCSEVDYYGVPLQSEAPQTAAGVNGLKKTFSYECPGNTFLTGESSNYNGPSLDRSFSFSCSSLKTPNGTDLKKSACQWSAPVNGYAGAVNYSCPEHSLAVGIQSDYIQNTVRFGRHAIQTNTDRTFKYECCGFEEESLVG